MTRLCMDCGIILGEKCPHCGCILVRAWLTLFRKRERYQCLHPNCGRKFNPGQGGITHTLCQPCLRIRRVMKDKEGECPSM